MRSHQFCLLLIFLVGLTGLPLTINCEFVPSELAPQLELDDGYVDDGSDGNELSLVFMIHRHGDRSPYFLTPKDPYKDSMNDIWPLGPGELTNEGKERMYKLGQYFRRRYANFLTTDPREVHSWSSGVDRCIASAQLLLAGLYPPEGIWTWNKELAWQPMAIHTRPQEDDPMLNIKAHCPTREDEFRKVYTSEELMRDLYESEEGRFFKSKLITEYGYQFRTPIDYYRASSSLEIERDAGLWLPDWLTTKNLKTLNTLAFRGALFASNTDPLKRLIAGVALEEIVVKMKQVPQRDEMTRNSRVDLSEVTTKLYIYCTHDLNILSILNALGALKGEKEELPEFGATILIEFYRNKELPGDYSVKLLYLVAPQKEDKGLRELKLTVCAKDGQSGCSLNDFDQSTRKYQLTPKEWHRECDRKE